MLPAPLGRILARYPAAVQPLSPPEPLGNAGGLSGARLWRFRSALLGPLVARAWPQNGRSRAEIQRVHDWLSLAKHLEFVPIPIPSSDGQTLHEESGTLWEIAPWMPGSPELRSPPSRAKVLSAFSALASFHLTMRSLARVGPSPGLASRTNEIANLTTSHTLSVWRAAVLRRPNDPVRVMSLRWLDLAARIAPRLLPEIRRASSVSLPLQPVLRDARPDHFLFTDNRVTGLVDFGAMEIDPVSADLARLLAEWIGPDGGLRAGALNAYISIRKLDAVETQAIEVFQRSGMLLAGGRWVRWHYLDGIVFEDASAVRAGLERSLHRLETL